MNNTMIVEPKDYQIDIIQKIKVYLERIDNKCVMVMPCGSGKTFTSLFISKEMKCKNVLVFVPSIVLKQQWNLNITNMSFDSNVVFTISTYKNSCNILKKSILSNKLYDIIIFDECHHISNKITESNEAMVFSNSLKIKSKYKLFITATFKKHVNDDVSVFGEIVTNLNTKWAVENNIICDYQIEVFIYEKKSIDYYSKLKANRILINTDMLYISAKSALDKILNGSSKHVLIYTNTIKSSEEIIQCIQEIISQDKYNNISDLDYFSYTSATSSFDKNKIISCFHKKYSIISCVYALGEGVDLPSLDTVIFGEEMSSDIRIIQSALRPCRLYKNKCKATIFIPVLCDNFRAFPSEFKKVRKVILSMIDGDEEFIKQRINISSDQNNINLDTEVDRLWDKVDVSKIFNNLILNKNEFKKICDKEFFLDNNFTFCKIVECKIDNSGIDIKKLSLNGVVLYLYTKINDTDTIMEKTTYGAKSIVSGKHPDNKVPYIESLNLSVRNKCANDCVKEIYNLCEQLHIKIYLRISLHNGKEVKYIR